MTNQPSSVGSDMSPGAALLGREWLALDDTQDTGSIRFLAQPSFTNRYGTIQGGFLAAMLDSATGVRALAAGKDRRHGESRHPLSQARQTWHPDRSRGDR